MFELFKRQQEPPKLQQTPKKIHNVVIIDGTDEHGQNGRYYNSR